MSGIQVTSGGQARPAAEESIELHYNKLLGKYLYE
jgi:hypothetical protein